MPFKFSDGHRDKFAKPKYRVTNPAAYTESLRRRGDLTVWFSSDAAKSWAAQPRNTRGRPQAYSDMAIEVCLTLRVVFGLPLRQTQGFVRSIAQIMGLDIAVPDFTTLSRRGKGLKIVQRCSKPNRPITLIVDSTGLKVHSDLGWHYEKHNAKKPRKTWLKLHVGFDPGTGQIVTSELTAADIGDPTALPDLLAQSDADVGKFLADGAYDGQDIYAALEAAFGHDIEIIIPPPKNAVPSENPKRNDHIEDISETGRMNWQAASDYNHRALIEAQIGRWKIVIGDRLKARYFDNQRTETRIATNVLNRMTDLGRATYERVC